MHKELDFYEICMMDGRKALVINGYLTSVDGETIYIYCSNCSRYLDEVSDFGLLAEELLMECRQYVTDSDQSEIDSLVSEYGNRLRISDVTLRTPCGKYTNYY